MPEYCVNNKFRWGRGEQTNLRLALRPRHGVTDLGARRVGRKQAERVGVRLRRKRLVRDVVVHALRDHVGPDAAANRRADALREVEDGEVPGRNGGKVLVLGDRLNRSLDGERDGARAETANDLNRDEVAERSVGRAVADHETESENLQSEEASACKPY